MSPRADRVHPHQALAVYAEPLAAGRRVVVLGDADTGLSDRLEELGALSVVLVTPDEDLDQVRAARFDLAIVADLERFADPGDVLARVRRMVGESGAALVAAPNRAAAEVAEGSLDYYALFDLVAREFAEVRMVAQLPFHGVALAEVGEEDDSPAVSVDTQLADPDRAPEAFIAVASQRGTSLDPYAIVELPPAEASAPDESALDAARAELDATVAALDVARADRDGALGQVGDAHRQLQALAVRLEAHEVRAARASGLERDLAERGRQLAELSAEVEQMRSAAEAGSIAASQVEALALRADRAERALAAALPEGEGAIERQAEELLRYEEALRERALAVRTLEAEVARREKLVRELVATIEEQASSGSATGHAGSTNGAPDPVLVAALTDDNARLQRKLDGLALDLARREADSQATAWKVAELERRLASSPSSSGRAAPASSDVLDQLDALRRALTQEHEARVRAESGEELARARAEIQRQSALLSQLGQPPAET
ncbi:MAG TPA: hypothetical protein VIF09_28945 [Polyangiaceae bacterium]|jgi:hypothetical protein